MRAELRHGSQRLCEIIGNDARLQGSQADAADPLHLMYLPDQA